MVQKYTNYLSIIAIILSIIAISIIIVSSNNQQYNNLDTRIQQVFGMAVNNEQQARSNLFEATDELQRFHTCINYATRNFILCDFDGHEKSYCYSLYTEARQNCETILKKSYWFE